MAGSPKEKTNTRKARRDRTLRLFVLACALFNQASSSALGADGDSIAASQTSSVKPDKRILLAAVGTSPVQGAPDARLRGPIGSSLSINQAMDETLMRSPRATSIRLELHIEPYKCSASEFNRYKTGLLSVMAQRSYEIGKSDMASVLLAQQANLEIRNEYLDAVYAYEIAYTDLEQSVGTTFY